MKNHTHRNPIGFETLERTYRRISLRVEAVFYILVYILSGDRHPGIEGYLTGSQNINADMYRGYRSSYVADVVEYWEGNRSQCTNMAVKPLNLHTGGYKKND